MRKITITIGKGKVTVKPEGYKGHECKDVTKAFEKALGATVSSTDTPEMYEEGQQEFLTEKQ